MTETERDRVRESLKELSTLDLTLADSAPGILYAEDINTINILKEFSRITDHVSYRFFNESPYFHTIGGCDVNNATRRFFALTAAKQDINGVLLLDGDNRELPDHEVRRERLVIARWHRYEIESYLIVPGAIKRFLKPRGTTLFDQIDTEAGFQYLEEELPPGVLNKPLAEHPVLTRLPVSKTLLPEFFKKIGIGLPKRDYYQIASVFKPEEVHPEITEKLDLIAQTFGL